MTLRASLTARMVALGAGLAVAVGLAIGAMLLTIASMRDASRTACSSGRPLRYGRSLVIASTVSATAKIRAHSGMPSSSRPAG